MYQDISAQVPNIQLYEDLFPGPRVIKSGRQLCTQLTGTQVYKTKLNGEAFLQFILTNGP